MYIVKIHANSENNRWVQNGGRLILEALFDGEFNEVDENGELRSILPPKLTNGVGINFERPHKFFVGHNLYGVKITDSVMATSPNVPLIQDVFNILPDMKWSVFNSFEAMELMKLCYRIKYRNECPIEFSEIHTTLPPLSIIYFNDYDEATSRKDRELLFKYCIDTNNKGAFLFFPDFYSGKTAIKELKEMRLAGRQRVFSEAEWLSLKYSSF